MPALLKVGQFDTFRSVSFYLHHLILSLDKIKHYSVKIPFYCLDSGTLDRNAGLQHLRTCGKVIHLSDVSIIRYLKIHDIIGHCHRGRCESGLSCNTYDDGIDSFAEIVIDIEADIRSGHSRCRDDLLCRVSDNSISHDSALSCGYSLIVLDVKEEINIVAL